jgi:hypothetical protein
MGPPVVSSAKTTIRLVEGQEGLSLWWLGTAAMAVARVEPGEAEVGADAGDADGGQGRVGEAGLLTALGRAHAGSVGVADGAAPVLGGGGCPVGDAGVAAPPTRSAGIFVGELDLWNG